jgi:hypothetical protein
MVMGVDKETICPEGNMFARPEDLSKLAGLGGRPFEELVYDLVRDEAFRHGIPYHKVHWDFRTTRPDGGRDIIVEDGHSDSTPPFVPQRPSIWSAKSGKNGLDPAELRKELLADSHDALREHLRNGNPYIWAILEPIDEDQRDALLAKAKEVAEISGFDSNLVEIRARDVLYSTLEAVS